MRKSGLKEADGPNPTGACLGSPAGAPFGGCLIEPWDIRNADGRRTTLRPRPVQTHAQILRIAEGMLTDTVYEGKSMHGMID